jgi:hypothetical protein
LIHPVEEVELEEPLEHHSGCLTMDGKSTVDRNGYRQARQILAGI